MRKLLTLLTAVLFVGSVMAGDIQHYFEGWESHHRTSGNNDYGQSAKTYGDFSFVYADAVSGSDISGSYLATCRVAGNTTNSPYIESGSLLTSNETINKIRWNIKGNGNLTVHMYYKTSSDGSWTEKSSKNGNGNNIVKDSAVFNPAITGPIYIKFAVTVESSTSSKRDISIDDITIFGPAPAVPTLSISPTSWDFEDVRDYESASKEFTISGEYLEEEALTIGVTGGYTVSPTSIAVNANGELASNKVTVTKNTETGGDNDGELSIYGGGVAAKDAVTASLSMNVIATYLVTVDTLVYDKNLDEISNAGFAASINGGTSVHVESASDVLTLSATPKAGFEFDSWSVPEADKSKITFTDKSAASTTAYATAAVTITATFVEMECDPLDAPSAKGSVVTEYPSVTFAWNEVENAELYEVKIYQNSVLVAEDLVDVLSYTNDTLVPNTYYTYTVMAAGDGNDYCDESNPPLEGNFTTDDYPAATLTLSENGATHNLAGDHKLYDVVTLPTDVQDGNRVAGKELAGWTTSTIAAETDIKPTIFYSPGAEYTLDATSTTLYAVYAKETEGASTTHTLTKNNTSWTGYTTGTQNDDQGATWSYYASGQNSGGTYVWVLNTNANNYNIGSPTFTGRVKSIDAYVINTSTKDARNIYICSSNETAQPSSGDLGSTSVPASNNGEISMSISGKFSKFYIYTGASLQFKYIVTVVGGDITYSKYATSGEKVPTAIDNTEVGGKAVKVMRNGILLIEKNGHTYNAMGQLVK